MFASRNNNQAKVPEGRRPERDDSTPDRKTSSEENPIWRSLAMRSGILQTKLTIGKADDPYEREADRVADQVMRMPAPQSDGHALSITPVNARQAQRKCAEGAEEEEGKLQRYEIDLPKDEGENTNSFPNGNTGTSDINGDQEQSNPSCLEPFRMEKVTDEKLHGKISDGSDLTMLDYYPDLVTKGYLHNIRNAGPFDTGKHAGANVQLYGTIASPCRPELFTLAQTKTYTVDKENGISTAKEGSSGDDLKDSGRDPSKAPFRQDWLDDDGYHISMADTPSYGELGQSFSSDTNIEYVKDYVTSLIGPGGEKSVSWTARLKIENGEVTENKVE